MSNSRNNGWKIHRRNPSSTADARRALAIMFASAISAELKITDNGSVFKARFPASSGIPAVEAPTLALLSVRICAAVPSAWWTGQTDSVDINRMLLRCCESLTAANTALAEANAHLVNVLLNTDEAKDE